MPTATVQATLSVTTTTNSQTKSLPTVSASVTNTSNRDYGNVQSIGTTQEAIAIGSDITTPGLCRLYNRDATNYIEIGIVVSATFYPVHKLMPNDPPYLARIAAGATLYAKANTASCDLEVNVWDS